MKTKIEIKSYWGKVLFEYEKEDNTVKKTVEKAVSEGADLSGADLRCANLSDADLSGADLRGANLRLANLRGADLSGANLRLANLSGADLSDADLRGANLRGADLSGANLRGADLSGADLRGADLRGADLRGAKINGITIKKCAVFTGLYRYIVITIISQDGEMYVKMGCHFRKLSEWETDFWNNQKEFPNDNSESSNLRLFAFETAKRWFNVIEAKSL